MTDNDLIKFADMIYTDLNSLVNRNKSKEEQLEIIKKTIIKATSESRLIGRLQIMNYMEDEIKKLRSM